MKFFLAITLWALAFFTCFYFLFIGYDAMAILAPLTAILYHFVINIKKINIIPHQKYFVEKYKESFIYILFFKGIEHSHATTSDYSKRSIYYYRNMSLICLLFSTIVSVPIRNSITPNINYIEEKEGYIQNVERNSFDTYSRLTLVTMMLSDNTVEKFFYGEELEDFKYIPIDNLYSNSRYAL